MSRFAFALPSALVLVLAAFMALPSLARADEPRLEVRSLATRCEQPFEVTATGLEPSKPVLVSFAFVGTADAGAVAGNSDATGRFFSPIPRVLLPCVEGGKVTASITVDGKLLAITAQFEVAVPGAPPTAPQVGNSTPAESGTALWPLATGAGLFLAMAGLAFSLIRRRTQP